MMRNMIKVVLLILHFTSGHVFAEDDKLNYNVKFYGAFGDGKHIDTPYIQKAIDDASENGGGVVIIPPGVYYTETLVLKDHVTLFIVEGAVLLGSTTMTDYKPEFGSFKDSSGRQFGTALIFAKDATDINIKGNGMINGQGFKEYYPVKKGIARPSLIRFIDCHHVLVEDVTLINSAAWVQHYVQCEDLTIRGITVRSYANKNNDGLDIEGCKRVYITGCNIDSGDDSIVLKTLSDSPCRDVVISDCIVSGLKSAIKTGTESAAGFENITISNCTFYGTRGLTFYTVDGGNINNITVSNISMRDSYGVICLRLGSRMRPYSLSEDKKPESPGSFQNVMLSNIQAMSVTESNCFISGIPGHIIENVTLDNIRISYKGGGLPEDSQRIIPELPEEYPKPRMFGTLPAYGLFVRHAKNIKLCDIHFSIEEKEQRSVLFFDDVEGLIIDDILADAEIHSAPYLWLKNSRFVVAEGCRSSNRLHTFVKIEGSLTEKIVLIHNQFSQAEQPVKMGKEISLKEIQIRWNY